MYCTEEQSIHENKQRVNMMILIGSVERILWKRGAKSTWRWSIVLLNCITTAMHRVVRSNEEESDKCSPNFKSKDILKVGDDDWTGFKIGSIKWFERYMKSE